MECIDPTIGSLIALYEFGQLTEEQRKAFESHLLNCDACFQSVYEMMPAIQEMRMHAEIFLPVLSGKKKPAVGAILARIRGGVLTGIKKVIAPWPRPVRIAAALGAIAIILLIILLPQQAPKYAELARMEPIPYVRLDLRGAAPATENGRLFDQAMDFYSKQNYEDAVKKFDLLLAREPGNAEVHFYSGLCRLLMQDADGAIGYFTKAIQLGGNGFAEKLHWYLGNAYLLQNNGKQALAEFRKVVQFEGDFEWEAKEMVERIQKVKGKSKK